MAKNNNKITEEPVEELIEDVEADLDALFAEDFVPETSTRKSAEPKKLPEHLISAFVDKFRNVVEDGESKNMGTIPLLKAFGLDTTVERKIKGTNDKETVERDTLPPYVINSLGSANVIVEKIRGNAGYELTYADMDNMEDLGEVESTEVEIPDEDSDVDVGDEIPEEE